MHDKDIGSVAVGKFADIIAVQDDSLADITQMMKVEFVMKAGTLCKHDGKLKL